MGITAKQTGKFRSILDKVKNERLKNKEEERKNNKTKKEEE